MNSSQPRVAIIGVGYGGTYLIVELAKAGIAPTVYDIDSAKIARLASTGGVALEDFNLKFAPVTLATTDLAVAVMGCEIIILCTAGINQEAAARTLAPLLVDGQIILLVQGNTGGSLVVSRALTAAGCSARVDIAEMDNFPLSAWWRGPTLCSPIISKRWLQVAAFPGSRTAAVFERISPLFPSAVAAATIASTGFTNMNAVLHVANCVANAGLIDRGGHYKFYGEGVTPLVARLYEAINAESRAIAMALGAEVPTMAEWFQRVYGVIGASLPEICGELTTSKNGPYQATPSPSTFKQTFILEDVPVGLIPMSAIGHAVGVSTSAIDSVMSMVHHMSGIDFSRDARTLVRMGLNGMSVSKIKSTLAHGFSIP